jgi:cell division septation protein DedD
MSRVLKIVSVAVLLFLSYMWISVLTKSCNKSKEIEFPNQKVATPKDDEFGKEDFFEENDTIDPSLPTSTPSKNNAKEPIDYTEIDKKIQENKSEKPVTSPKEEVKIPSTEIGTKPQDSKISAKPIVKPIIKPEVKQINEIKKTSAVKSGNYVVIAGNYLVESNADAMIKRLKKAGFTADKAIFNLSEFHTVIVGRYKDNAAAAKTAFILKEKGFDVYVQKPK